jgi:hypothetical protein
LDFLKTFQTCSDTASPVGDQLNIIASADKKKVYFNLITDQVRFIQEKDFSDSIDIEMSISLSQFNSMLSFCKDDDDIDIKIGKIKFGNNSEYDFESFNFNVEQFNDLLNISTEGETVEIKDLSKIDKISFSIGLEPELACSAFQDNYFISYKQNPRSHAKILSFIKSENNISENFYLPQVFFKLFSIYKFDTITIKKISDEFLFMNINDMKIYMSLNDYSIPYIFDDSIKAIYEYNNFITVNKELFKTALSRIKVLNQKTIFNRVFIYFNEGNIKIEIKNNYNGFEIVNAEVAPSLYNFYFICSTISLFEILSNITSSNIVFNLDANEELRAIRITDDKSTQNHVLTLIKKDIEE